MAHITFPSHYFHCISAISQYFLVFYHQTILCGWIFVWTSTRTRCSVAMAAASAAEIDAFTAGKACVAGDFPALFGWLPGGGS